MEAIIDAKMLTDEILDSEQKGILAILKQTNQDILTDDFAEDRHINYHLSPPTAEWIKERFVYMPETLSVKEKYEEHMVSLLLSVDPNMLMTLHRIYFISKEEHIADVCKDAGAEECEFPECIDFEDEDGKLGCNWGYYSSIIINMHEIERTVNDIACANIDQEMFDGLLLTLVHEIRHLGLSNPFFSGMYSESEDTEEAVEQWAYMAYENWLFEK